MRHFHLITASIVLAAAQSAFGILVDGTATGAFVNPVGAGTVIANGDTNGTATINWGTPLTGNPDAFNGQFTFDGVGSDGDAPWSIASESAFKIGAFTYRNGQINAETPPFTGIDLTIFLALSRPLVLTQPFTFHLEVTEVPNDHADPADDADIVAVTNPSPTVFTFDGQDYTLEILGFSQNGGSTITTTFNSLENSTATADMYARITANVPAVPEPTTALFGVAMLGAMAWGRRRRTA
jgi:hypothetical protein